jgi:hypothetical protein
MLNTNFLNPFNNIESHILICDVKENAVKPA